VYSERFGHDGGEHAEQEAVAEAREARDEAQEVRVGDDDGAQLGDREDEAGNDETPDPAGVQNFDQKVGSDP
jgi:hypothetical protein